MLLANRLRMLKLNSFSVELRGTWMQETGTRSSSDTFLASFSDTTAGGKTITKTGTFDPQSGDILLCMQAQVRNNAWGSTNQHPNLNSSGTMTSIDSRVGTSYVTSAVVNTKEGPITVYTDHNPTYCVSYKVLTGSDVSYTGAQGFSSGGEGNIHQFMLFRPSAAVADSNVTHVGISNPGTSNSALSNQTIAAHTTSSAVIQYAVEGSGSAGSASAQTLTTMSNQLQVEETDIYANCGMVAVLYTGANAAVGVDRGSSNYLHSGQFRITAP
jgi:hypothetical protein